MPLRNGVMVATRDPKKKPVWEMTKAEQEDETTVVFDFDELLEFAEGNIGPVFGPEFSIIDNYRRRVRLPAREYLLVSRVTRMNATPGKFEVGGSMVTEYDLPVNGELSLGGDIPWAILVESGQCDLMLISYMGIDFQCKGERVYRLLDTTLTFYGVASEGETLVYDIKVNNFAKGKNGEMSMFFFEYDCYCNGKLLIEMRNGAAGFFSNEELAAGKGVLRTRAEDKMRAKIAAETKANPDKVKKFMIKPCVSKTTFSEQDMQDLVEKKWGKVMGETYAMDYRLATPKMLMIDRITHLDPSGGVHGLGLIVGEKILDRNHWYFPCHFVKDQVMAGSLVSDGCSQMMKVYMMWLGLHLKIDGAFQFRPVDGNPNKVRCRGQISPHKGKLVYVMEIRDMGFDKDGNPYAVADVDILDIDFEKGQTFDLSMIDQYGKGDLTKKIVVDFKGVALAMKGRAKVNGGGVAPSAKAMLPAPAIPVHHMKGDNQVVNEATWHPMYHLLKQSPDARTPSFFPSRFPPRPICFTPFLKNKAAFIEWNKTKSTKVELKEILNEIDLNFTPGEMPMNFYNMCEFMCGNVSNCLGDEFSIFDVSRTSRSPAFDLAFVSRVVKVEGIEKKNMLGIDVNPGKGTMFAEFDVPSDAWFFQGMPGNGKHLPYSIIMEIGLQTSGILTSVLKAPLTMKKKDILFRNLDAKSEMKVSATDLDLRGKTIINKSWCTGYNMLGKMGIHRFKFELYIKDNEESGNGDLDNYIKNYEGINLKGKKPFYVGDTSFGWFVPEVFESQVGLDNGKQKEPYFIEQNKTARKFSAINESSGKQTFTGGDSGKLSMLRKTSQSEYLDEINILPANEGKHGKGYLHGKKTVDFSDWFFSCHFWNDPVMPGSLGIESMFQLMEYHAIDQDLFKGFKNPMFSHSVGPTSWKYRGQLSLKSKLMEAEVHIKDVIKKAGSIEIIADASLFVDKLRVYETTDIRVAIVESGVETPKLSNGSATQNGKLSVSSGFNNKLKVVNSSSPGRKISLEELKKNLLDVEKTINIKTSSSGEVFLGDDGYQISSVDYADLGDASYMKFYGVKANLYTGAMAKGIASADLVIAMGKKNLLASFGAGGLPMHVVEKNLERIKAELGGLPFAVNLIHSPFDPQLEQGNVDLFKKFGVTVSEASAFMNLTLPVIEYRVSGLVVKKCDAASKSFEVEIGNKLIAKCSRTEVAEMFLRPPPQKYLDTLLSKGKITKEQAEAAKYIPIADDVTIEADSGGHTDNRQLHVILPLVINLRNRIFEELKNSFAGVNMKISTTALGEKINLEFPYRVRVGAGGGIGCPEGAQCAYALGAQFVVTGTVNQMCRESGTCDTVRGYLAGASYSDVTMAPAADMFDQGVQLQVLKKGTMFPSRAKKLYDLFIKYNSFEEMPEKEIQALEKRILKKTIAEVWQETKDFYIQRLHNPEKIQRAEGGDTKLKMSLCFRWYLGLSSFWANSGAVDRKTDYQVWCGPAIGAFNNFIKGSYLDPEVSGVYPEVVQANLQILNGARYLQRLNQIKFNPSLEIDTYGTEIASYVPDMPLRI